MVPFRARTHYRLPLLLTPFVLLVASACGGGAPASPATAPSPSVASVPTPLARPSLVVPSPSPARVVGSPSPAAPTAAAKPTAAVTGGESYTVVAGDTLLLIAEKFYGDQTAWRRIYDANRDVIGADPNSLKIDMKLRIPPKES